MPRPAITVENLSKAYRIGLKEEIPDTLVGALASFARSPYDNFRNLRRLNTFRNNGHAEDDIVWALKDVSFEVQKGEVVGIIGRNGAGKSTLLKILSRITEPTSGRAVIRGRVSSLLEVGTGFHPELSGRENIYMNGTILGMKKREIDRKFDEIVDFSGVEKFLDTPIKRYSSGMKVRLAFSVAAHLEPEILVIDEVLAVGDLEFQNKCIGKMDEVARSGRTVLFVSHNMAAVENLCTRAVLLESGQFRFTGSTDQVMTEYLGLKDSPTSEVDLTGSAARCDLSCVLRRIRTLDEARNPTTSIPIGGRLSFEIYTLTRYRLTNVVFAIHVHNSLGVRVVTLHSRHQHSRPINIEGAATVCCTIPRCHLLPGRYSVTIAVAANGATIDHVDSATSFEVSPADFYGTGLLPSSRKDIYAEESFWEQIPVIG